MKKPRPATIKSLLSAALAILAVAIIDQPLAAMAAGKPTTATGGGGGGGSVAPVAAGYITSFKVTTGYPPRGNGIYVAAVWTNFSVKANPAVPTPYVRIRYTDWLTGAAASYLFAFASNTIDADALPFNTKYMVELEVLDASGNVVDVNAAVITTPGPKTATTP
jgi:hypothetical protein